MQFSATWNVLIFQVMHKLRSLKKQAGSVSQTGCLALVTDVTFVNIMVLGFGLCLCLSYSNMIFLLLFCTADI